MYSQSRDPVAAYLTETIVHALAARYPTKSLYAIILLFSHSALLGLGGLAYLAAERAGTTPMTIVS